MLDYLAGLGLDSPAAARTPADPGILPILNVMNTQAHARPLGVDIDAIRTRPCIFRVYNHPGEIYRLVSE